MATRCPIDPSTVVGIVACDTTGVEVGDVPISIGLLMAALDEEGEWVEVARWEGRQAPEVPIAPNAQAIHGISLESLAGERFDLANLTDLLDCADVLASLHPQFTAKMLAKVVPGVLEQRWRTIPSQLGTGDTGVRLSAMDGVVRLFDQLQGRFGKTRRSKTHLTRLVGKEDMPVYPHKEGRLPLKVSSRAVFGKLFTQTLSLCPIGTMYRLWTQPGMDYIAGYATMNGFIGGQGLSFHLPKEKNPALTTALESGEHPVARLLAVDGFTLNIEVDPLRAS